MVFRNYNMVLAVCVLLVRGNSGYRGWSKEKCYLLNQSLRYNLKKSNFDNPTSSNEALSNLMTNVLFMSPIFQNKPHLL